MGKREKFYKGFNFTIKHASLGILAALAWVGFSDLVSTGTNITVVYLLGVALIGSLLNNVLSK